MPHCTTIGTNPGSSHVSIADALNAHLPSCPVLTRPQPLSANTACVCGVLRDPVAVLFGTVCAEAVGTAGDVIIAGGELSIRHRITEPSLLADSM